MAKHMTVQEKKDWDALYLYVKKNVMGYDDNQSLSQSMARRLKGLLVNKFMVNDKIPDTANYSYQTVLNTFKFCMPDIQKGFRNNSFRDENHKFNYAIKIVESNINTVYLRMKQAKKTEEDVSNHDISDSINYVNTFKPRENKHDNKKKYADLW